MQAAVARQRLRRIAIPKTVESGTVLANRIPWPICWSFVAFALSLPFETLVPSTPFLLFVALFFFYFNPLLGKRSFPPVDCACWCFFTFLAIYVAKCLFTASVTAGSITRIFLVVLFWIGTHVMREEKTAKNALVAYAVAASLLAIGVVLRIPGFSVETNGDVETRATAFGVDANVIAMFLALGANLLLGFQLNNSFRQRWIKRLLMALILPVLIGIVQTGSRTGAAAFAIGTLAHLFPSRRARHKMTTIILAIFALAAAAYLAMQNPTSRSRWEATIYEGKLAGRENITPAAIDMFLEQPLLGWDLREYQIELARRVGLISSDKDTHNLVLLLLLEVGIAGTIPFLAGLWFCLQGAWRARNTEMGNLPLACLLTVLSAGIGVSMITRKPLWLILAVCSAAGTNSSPIQAKQVTMRLRRRVIV
jgi:O-antigen ligase